MEGAWKHNFLPLINMSIWGHCLAWIHCQEVRSRKHERHLIVQKFKYIWVKLFPGPLNLKRTKGVVPLLWQHTSSWICNLSRLYEICRSMSVSPGNWASLTQATRNSSRFQYNNEGSYEHGEITAPSMFHAPTRQQLCCLANNKQLLFVPRLE